MSSGHLLHNTHMICVELFQVLLEPENLFCYFPWVQLGVHHCVYQDFCYLCCIAAYHIGAVYQLQKEHYHLKPACSTCYLTSLTLQQQFQAPLSYTHIFNPGYLRQHARTAMGCNNWPLFCKQALMQLSQRVQQK